MTGLTILLFGFAGVLLVSAVGAIYAHEYPRAQQWWKNRGHPSSRNLDELASTLRSVASQERKAESETAEVRVDPAGNIGTAGASGTSRRRSYPRDVFKYTIRKPVGAVRKKMPDLGGFSEVPLRLYDQLGNRFTVHQKVRLN